MASVFSSLRFKPSWLHHLTVQFPERVSAYDTIHFNCSFERSSIFHSFAHRLRGGVWIKHAFSPTLEPSWVSWFGLLQAPLHQTPKPLRGGSRPVATKTSGGHSVALLARLLETSWPDSLA